MINSILVFLDFYFWQICFFFRKQWKSGIHLEQLKTCKKCVFSYCLWIKIKTITYELKESKINKCRYLAGKIKTIEIIWELLDNYISHTIIKDTIHRHTFRSWFVIHGVHIFKQTLIVENIIYTNILTFCVKKMLN